jgi:hypothetical protein
LPPLPVKLHKILEYLSGNAVVLGYAGAGAPQKQPQIIFVFKVMFNHWIPTLEITVGDVDALFGCLATE